MSATRRKLKFPATNDPCANGCAPANFTSVVEIPTVAPRRSVSVTIAESSPPDRNSTDDASVTVNVFFSPGYGFCWPIDLIMNFPFVAADSTLPFNVDLNPSGLQSASSPPAEHFTSDI